MKVIIIKDCKDGKVNEIVEVKDGYAKNFLIKQQFAVPLNEFNNKRRAQKIATTKAQVAAEHQQALVIKDKIEKLHLMFGLKTTNNLVHGSITKKQIINQLKQNDIRFDAHALPSLKINTIGITKVNIKLAKDVSATLVVEVKDDK